MAAKKAVLSMVISCVMGAVFVFVALFAGTFFYTMNVPDVAPFNPEMAGHALGVAFLSFLMIIVPFKWVIYRKLGYGINLVLFFLVPVLAFLFIGTIGPLPALITYWVVGSLVFYQFLAAKNRPPTAPARRVTPRPRS